MCCRFHWGLFGGKRKKKSKNKKRKVFLTESGPPVLISPRWRPLSSSRDHHSAENLPSISNGPPFLVEVHCGSVDDVVWDLLYIFIGRSSTVPFSSPFKHRHIPSFRPSSLKLYPTRKHYPLLCSAICLGLLYLPSPF